MSAWYILSSVGFYQVDPAGGRYVFGSPLFDEATLNVGNGKTFRVVAHNNSSENKYIQSAKLNGKPYTRSYIDFKDIVRGGTLEFVMGNKPSQFGVKPSDRPQAMIKLQLNNLSDTHDSMSLKAFGESWVSTFNYLIKL